MMLVIKTPRHHYHHVLKKNSEFSNHYLFTCRWKLYMSGARASSIAVQKYFVKTAMVGLKLDRGARNDRVLSCI